AAVLGAVEAQWECREDFEGSKRVARFHRPNSRPACVRSDHFEGNSEDMARSVCLSVASSRPTGSRKLLESHQAQAQLCRRLRQLWLLTNHQAEFDCVCLRLLLAG